MFKENQRKNSYRIDMELSMKRPFELSEIHAILLCDILVP